MPRIEHIVENNIEKKHCGKCKTYKLLEVFGNSCSSWVINSWTKLYKSV